MTLFHSTRCWLLLLLACSAFSPLDRAAAAPIAPSNCFAYAPSSNGAAATISINWTDNSTDETAWQIKYSVDGSAYTLLGGNPIASSFTTSSSPGTTGKAGFTWTGALANHVYRFKIVANNGVTASGESNVATVGTYSLGAPVNLGVTMVDPFNVKMAWEEQSCAETGFAIEMKSGTGAWTYLGAVPANSLGIAASALIYPAGSFSFRVRAFTGSEPDTPDFGGANVSAYSNVVTINSLSYVLTANKVSGKTMVNLSWPNVQNETGYEIFARSQFSGTYSLIGVVAADVTTYQALPPGIEPANLYYFVVRPFDTGGFMGSSTAVAVTVDGVTSTPGASGTPGSALSHTFTQISGSTVSSRTLTGVPSTLAFDSGTGILTGVLPDVGNYSLLYTVNFADGSSMTQTFYIRVRPAEGSPVVGAAIPAWAGVAGTSHDSPLAGAFTDAEAESAVRVVTTLGTMDFILFDTATPLTVANFMSYVNAGDYTDVAFHRSVANFVIQGGGFKGMGSGTDFSSVVTVPPVTNEPGIPNVRGTISMAKSGGDPNSATSQFFVSVNDNRANLDYQNGGFTVFGRVASNGMAVADAINALPAGTYNLYIDGSATATPMSGIPMNAATAPDPMDQSKLVNILSVTPIPTLSYAVTDNTNPSVAEASIVNGQLHLVGLAGGETTLTVTATDLDNLTTTQTIPVSIADTFTSWATRNSFAGNQNSATQDPDGDGLTNLQEYAFFGDPSVPCQTVLPAKGSTGTTPATQCMTLTFPVRKFTSGLSYSVEANNQLSGTWTEVWNSAADPAFDSALVLTKIDQPDRTVVTVQDASPRASQPKRFVRVKVVQN